jgi:hypothetical protein
MEINSSFKARRRRPRLNAPSSRAQPSRGADSWGRFLARSTIPKYGFFALLFPICLPLLRKLVDKQRDEPLWLWSFPLQRLGISHFEVSSKATESFSFVFSTGRSASQHMSRLFVSHAPPWPVAYVTHQEEDTSMHARVYVDRFYRVFAAKQNEKEFSESARKFLKEKKIPFYKHVLATHGAKLLVYTGHLPMVFGLGPLLVDELAPARVRILRLRRDRISSALSLMALGPEEEDPWSPLAGSNRRWFPGPSSVVTRLRVAPVDFRSMNRFQRWLWYVDDVECRWQALRLTHGHRFQWMEESLEGLSAMDGGNGWRKVANFLGVDIDESQLSIRHNSIQAKGREKINATEDRLRQWDMIYRKLVGPCDVHGNGSLKYSWNTTLPG